MTKISHEIRNVLLLITHNLHVNATFSYHLLCFIHKVWQPVSYHQKSGGKAQKLFVEKYKSQ